MTVIRLENRGGQDNASTVAAAIIPHLRDLAAVQEESVTVDLWGTGAAVLIQYHRGAQSVIPGLVFKGRFSPMESGTDPHPVDPAERDSVSALSRTLATPIASAQALADEMSQRIGPWQS